MVKSDTSQCCTYSIDSINMADFVLMFAFEQSHYGSLQNDAIGKITQFFAAPQVQRDEEGQY